ELLAVDERDADLVGGGRGGAGRGGCRKGHRDEQAGEGESAGHAAPTLQRTPGRLRSANLADELVVPPWTSRNREATPHRGHHDNRRRHKDLFMPLAASSRRALREPSAGRRGRSRRRTSRGA